MRKISLIMPLLLLFQACRHNSLVIERNESLMHSDLKQVKLVCIDPRFYFDDENKNYELNTLGKTTDRLKKDILFCARKNKIELSLYDIGNLSPASYQDLLQLKQNMLDANFSQSTPLNFSSANYRSGSIQKRVFVYPPKISYEFSALSQKYGTPLFSYLGVYKVRDKLVLYHVVVDTDRCETIYRENKVIEGKLNKDKIAQMVYDSYALLGKELTQK